MRSLTRILATIAVLGVLLPSAGKAQVPGGVQQQGNVTANNCAKWVRKGVIADAGSTCGGGGGGSPGGSSGQVQYNNAGSFGGITGATTNGTALTLVAPILGTPASGTLTNTTGFPVAQLAGAGTGVLTALGVNIGSAGAPVLFNGAGGTPSSITLTNGSGLPVSTGISGLGTGIATALAVNVGSAGAPVLFNGAGGTPSSLTLTNATGLPIAGLTGLGTGVGTALAVNVGSAGAFITFNGAAGTPSAITLTNGTGLPISGITGLGTGVATALAAAMNGSTGPIGTLTPTNNNCVVGNGTAWTSAACSAGAGTVTSVTPGGGLVSGITASCTQTAITGSGTLSEARCINAQTGSTYAIQDSDRGKLVTVTNAAAIAVSIAQAGTASAFANGWSTTLMNVGATVATITPTTSTINGAAAYRLFPGQSITISSDGSNYQIDPGTTGGVTLSTQTGANYAIVAGDFGKLINLNNGSNQVPTLPNANTLGANWFVQVCNIGAGSQTITPSTSTIGGAATFVLPAASAARPACVGIVSDGTNYSAAPEFAMDMSTPTAGTLAVARGGTGITSFGTGVATAMGSNVNTNGGLLTASTAAIASNAIVTGAGSGTALTGTTPGTGVLTALGVNLSAAGGMSSTIASGTSALGTSAISSAACATVVTTSATNTATTDVIWWGFNADPTSTTGYQAATAGMLTIIAYPTANNVNFKVCNNTSSSITPGAVTLNWRVIR